MKAFFVLSCACAAFVFGACGTDNGATTHGGDYGPVAQRDARAPGATEPTEDAGAEEDAGHDVTTTSCSGTIAVLAGDDVSLTGAVRVNGAPWKPQVLAGGETKSVPALAAFGTGFVGAMRGAGDALETVSYESGFGSVTAIGSALTMNTPALVVVGTSAHLVYLGAGASANKFLHGSNTGSGFGAANDPVSFNANPSFGPSAPAVAQVGAGFVFAQDGDDGGLYVQAWNGSWTAASPVAGAGVYKPAGPTLLSLTGAFDLLLFYVDNATRRISFSLRNPTNAVTPWTTPAVVHMLATTDEPVSAVRVGSSSVLVAFRGQDGNGYYAIGTVGPSGVTFGPASPLGGAVDSPPSVAPGICGDDAIVAFTTGGQVKVARLRGATFDSLDSVTGAHGTRVAVATR